MPHTVILLPNGYPHRPETQKETNLSRGGNEIGLFLKGENEMKEIHEFMSEENFRKKFSARLGFLLKEKGITQYALIKRIRVSDKICGSDFYFMGGIIRKICYNKVKIKNERV